ncbi:unnamed protein product [Schistocephalus solidus]|uniref:RNA-directed DNA polymerase from mobile element jockey n=1 Tax=Schistocephalus solidus TaxID=70667 RepID=A0A183TNZ2_SCHSO|nr:unnamed protein product [Schistocephalus solidus]
MGAPIIQDMLFREEAVFEELKSLKACKSPGPDEIPAKLLLELARELAKPLSFLCQKSLDTGILPTDWKTAHITPLHKSGSHVNMAVDTVRTGILGLEEFPRSFSVGHGDDLSFIPIESMVALERVRKDEEQRVSAVDG